MTFGALRLPVARVLVALAYTVWVVAMAVPQCHVFTHAVAPHAHIEASGPVMASPAAPAILLDRHQHAAEPDRHVPADMVLAALPRAAALLVLLLVAAVPLFLAAPAAWLGGGVRAPPVAALPVWPGRDKLTRFGIDRN
ncbi:MULTISPECIES: hypothetical protein [Nocardia]|uniref:Lipoprotein LpqS n=1 Tax=Nocardia sputorum TaxID=2984338 RepID=A0ABM8D3L5_9NOCA|nr:hypothetical protein [Nocardia sputorum]BDU01954.1 hypothetical protein IFM12276_49820 [Nocardia sputorum]